MPARGRVLDWTAVGGAACEARHDEILQRACSAMALHACRGVVRDCRGPRLSGLNIAMDATNSLTFRTSCHAMRDNVFEEYKKMAHYSNRSGVRAVCADCHVPRDWPHKVARKVMATSELIHWALGSVDSREKFQAKRHELARHEWDRMRANDSRECRNCHSFQAMDFHNQTAKAGAAMKGGRTCIECHKGVAHTMPDVTAGHRAAFAALRTEPAASALSPARRCMR